MKSIYILMIAHIKIIVMIGLATARGVRIFVAEKIDENNKVREGRDEEIKEMKSS